VESFSANPLAWLDWIDRYRATVTWAPNFAFALVNDSAGQVEERRWDLSSMRRIVNAGEAVKPETVQRFLQILAPHGLAADVVRPAYGMSETTSAIVYSTLSRDDDRLGVHALRRRSLSGALQFASDSDEDVVRFVDVGAPIQGVQLRIVDKA